MTSPAAQPLISMEWRVTGHMDNLLLQERASREEERKEKEAEKKEKEAERKKKEAERKVKEAERKAREDERKRELALKEKDLEMEKARQVSAKALAMQPAPSPTPMVSHSPIASINALIPKYMENEPEAWLEEVEALFENYATTDIERAALLAKHLDAKAKTALHSLDQGQRGDMVEVC
ncbi:uncharacterized protein LOC135218975 [Macrobrachium nipponense]|uniref:uncharacterized protein LOC135218975 n=1 Tax=Macrobrachium nipponense TaxID=159736 RepID=UPI0030C82A50